MAQDGNDADGAQAAPTAGGAGAAPPLASRAADTAERTALAAEVQRALVGLIVGVVVSPLMYIAIVLVLWLGFGAAWWVYPAVLAPVLLMNVLGEIRQVMAFQRLSDRLKALDAAQGAAGGARQSA